MSLKTAAILFFVLATSSLAASYVLVQVRKGDNQSDVDALIHKVIPSEDIAKFTDDARKRYGKHKKYKIEKIQESRESKEAKEAKGAKEDKDLESVVFSIKSPEKNRQDNSMGGIIPKIFRFIKTFILDQSVRFTWKLQQYNITPKVVTFKSGKPSMLYQINVHGVIDSIKNFVNSNMFSKRSEEVIKKAAFLFRRFRDQFLNNRN